MCKPKNMSIFPRENAPKSRLLAFFVGFPIPCAHQKKRKSIPKPIPKLKENLSLITIPNTIPNSKTGIKRGYKSFQQHPEK